MSGKQVMLRDKEFVKLGQEDDTEIVVIDPKVNDALSENQNLLIDYENKIANKMFSEWMPIESEDQPRVSIAESVMKEEILIDEQQNYVKGDIVLKGNERDLNGKLKNTAEGCEGT